MQKHSPGDPAPSSRTRRRFLEQLGLTAAAGAAASIVPGCSGNVEAEPRSGSESPGGKIRYRQLGKTGLKVSEIGFGGHSWSYARVPDGQGGFRKTTVDEAVEMIRLGLDMGVNWLDSCTPLEESSTPGEALKRLGARDRVIVSVRVSHKMKGDANDRKEIYDWAEKRLELWQTDHIDVLMLCNTENDTPHDGYWDMSHSLEALDKLKQQGKIRYTGFGCHFPPALFYHAFENFGHYFDVCSIPYNVRHRAAEEVLAKAKQAGLGTVTIKPFARGSLLKGRDLAGADAGLPRDMLAFVLENEHVDVATCGVHTIEQVRENFSASWTPLTPGGRERLEVAAATPCDAHRWLEEGWRYA
jgi:aryl-alcohol dehydrogenase-like predicted oxidoreductase